MAQTTIRRCLELNGISAFWARQQSIKGFSEDAVALTCRVFEACAVRDGDTSSVISNESSLLQDAGDDSDRRSAHSKHLGQELLGQGKLILTDSIVGEQHPAGTTLFTGAEAVACDLLT